MDIKREIAQFAADGDKPILNWLFANYHYESQWKFVATCTHNRYGNLSYQTNRVWRPTEEGYALHLTLSAKNSS